MELVRESRVYLMVELADTTAAARIEPLSSPEVPVPPWIERSGSDFRDVWIDGKVVPRADFLVAVGDVLEGKPTVRVGSNVMIKIPQPGEEGTVKVNNREMSWREFAYGALDVVKQHPRGQVLDEMRDVVGDLAWEHFADYLALAPPRPGLYKGISQRIYQMAQEEKAKSPY